MQGYFIWLSESAVHKNRSLYRLQRQDDKRHCNYDAAVGQSINNIMADKDHEYSALVASN